VPCGVSEPEYCAWPTCSFEASLRDALHRRERIGAGDLDLAHVADVEQPGASADGHVLQDEARVLDGHVPPAERHHAGSRRAVTSVERRLLERGDGFLFHWGR
jgi:hypothetical protein